MIERMRGIAIIIGLTFTVASTVSFGHIVNPLGDDQGFEIGNGRKLIRNLAGKYGVNVPDKWEAGLFKSFTEVIAPLYEGTPRSRLQINVIKPTGATSPIELLKTKSEDTWTRVALAELEGIKKETILAGGVHEVDIELFRGKEELIVINLTGKPKEITSGAAPSSFDRLYRSLQTIHLGN